MTKCTIVTTNNTTAKVSTIEMTFKSFEEAFNYSNKMLSSCKYNNQTGVAYFEDTDGE